MIKRHRASSKKSRTGCRTCRVRHIKCDETPGACKKCTSTGRACAYDLQRLPRKCNAIILTNSERYHNKLISLEISNGPHWATTTDEQQCFSHFQYRTMPTLLEFFDTTLWKDLILRMSHIEPAVYHAVVALSAVHQDSEMHGMPLPGQDLESQWHQFALEQCGRSFSFLSRQSQDPRLKEVMLLCCLLFVLVELLRGQYDVVFKHLHSGLRILNEIKVKQNLDPSVLSAFITLDMQAMQFGAGGLLCTENQIDNGLDAFYSFQEARRASGKLLSAVSGFLVRCGSFTEAIIELNYESLHQEQLQFFSQLSRFDDSFEYFCSRHVLNSKEKRGADIIRLAHRSFNLALKICLLRGDSVFDYYTPEYDSQVSLAEEIIYQFPERPSFTLDIGIMPTLYFAAMWCRDFKVRYRAIEALLSWPHREGSFDSNWVAFIALERMKVESLTQPAPNLNLASIYSFVEKNGRWLDVRNNNYSLESALKSTRCMKNWPCIQYIEQIKSGRIGQSI